MSGKKADKPRYWVTYLLNDLPVGAVFKPEELHLTIIPWFVTEVDNKEVIDSFGKTFSVCAPFEATVGKIDEFNQERKIIFNHLGPKAEIVALHTKGLEWFSYLGARWALQHPRVEDEFIPHIRRRDGKSVSEGDKLLIDSLSLVRANRRADDSRIIAAKAELK